MKKILLVIILGILASSAYTKVDSFIKAGLGLGYDSNVFLDESSIGLGYGQAQLSSEFKGDGEKLKFVGRADAQLEVFSLFSTFNGRLGAGLYAYPSVFSFIKAMTYFNVYMDLSYSSQTMLEYEQDLGDTATSRVGYEYIKSWGLNTATNENIEDHQAWAGLNIDLSYRLFLDLEVEYEDVQYADLMTPAGSLHSRIWNATAKANLVATPLLKLELMYSYKNNAVNQDTLLIVGSTNLIYPYNNADVHQAGIKMEADLGIKTSLTLSLRKDWISLSSIFQSESLWKIDAKLEYFLNPSWKLDIPLSWDIYSSDISGQYQRVRSSIQLLYLW